MFPRYLGVIVRCRGSLKAHSRCTSFLDRNPRICSWEFFNMKYVVVLTLLLVGGWSNMANAFEPCGCNPVESWAGHSNNCSDHLWDGYCCERHYLGCVRGCGCACESSCNSGCDCMSSTAVPVHVEAAPAKPVVPPQETSPAKSIEPTAPNAGSQAGSRATKRMPVGLTR